MELSRRGGGCVAAGSSDTFKRDQRKDPRLVGPYRSVSLEGKTYRSPSNAETAFEGGTRPGLPYI